MRRCAAIRQLVARLTDGRTARPRIAFGSVVPGAERPRPGRRRLGVGPGARAAHPRARRPGSLGTRRDRRSSRAQGSWVRTSRSCIASALDDADVDAIAASGASVSLAPSSEMAGGSVSPPIQQLIDRDIRPGLGVDDERLTPGDLFAQMRATISMQHATVFDRKLAGKAGVPRLMSTRDVIRHATVDGARVAGLGAVTGSLEPGKQADIIVLRTDRPNIFPINDPIGAVVWGMDTSNVDWVFVGGTRRDARRRPRGGRRSAPGTWRRRPGSRVAAASGLAVGAAPAG